MKRLLYAALLLLASCSQSNIPVRITPLEERAAIARSLPDRIKPDRVKVGAILPVFTSVEGFDQEGKATGSLVSLIAADYDDGPLSDNFRKGRFALAATELEYFLNEEERDSVHLRLGFVQIHCKGNDKIYPYFAPRASLHSTTDATVFTLGGGYDHYFFRDEHTALHAGLGLEAHYYNVDMMTTAGWGSLRILEFPYNVERFGGTGFVRAGVELGKDLIIKGSSLNLTAEHHISLHGSRDEEGTRFGLYFIISIE